MRNLDHVVSDAELNVPMQDVEPTNIWLLAHNDPAHIREALELPVQRACWLLRDMGIQTVASTANRKNIGDGGSAGIAIDRATLSSYNLKQLQGYVREYPSAVQIHDRSIQFNVPIGLPEITAKTVSDAFVERIEKVGLKPQPALWAAPETPEEFLYGALNMRGRDWKPIPGSGKALFNRIVKAVSYDAELKEMQIEPDIAQAHSDEVELLAEFGKFEIVDGKPVFKGVHAAALAERAHQYWDEENGVIWKSEATKAYYEHCERNAAPEARQFPNKSHGLAR